MQDPRPGSSVIEVSGNQATVQLQMEESSDLQTWEELHTSHYDYTCGYRYQVLPF